MSRLKVFLLMGSFLLGGAGVWIANSPKASARVVSVYHSPTCGCCKKWVTHLEKNGFKVKTIAVDDVSSIKAEMGVPRKLASCHTAVVDGYVIEGHVPASAIEKLLSERPALKGIAVPGMPMGSPGMEGPYQERYQVVSFGGGAQEKSYMQF